MSDLLLLSMSERLRLPDRRRRKLETSALCGELVRELGAGADAELAVDARQRGLDGVLGEEEGGGDLAVRVAFGDERGDPALGLRQVVA